MHNPKNEVKKLYSTPRLAAFGDVEKLTALNGCVTSSDVPYGLDGTAYPMDRDCEIDLGMS